MSGRGRRAAVVGMAVGAFGVGSVWGPRPVIHATGSEDNAAADRGSRVGYVHVQRLLTESARAKAHGKSLAEVHQKYRDRVVALHAKVEVGQRQLVTAKPADLIELQQKLGADQLALRDLEAEVRREYDARSDRLVAEMYKEIAVVAAQVARDYGLDAVQTYPVPPGTLDVQQMKGLLGSPSALLYVRRDADLTDEVMKRLNQRYADEGGE